MLSISAIEAKYKRAMLNVTDTFLWSDMSNDQKDAISTQVELALGERVIIYYCKSLDYWWVITNQRLIISDNKTLSFCPFEMIIKVDFPGAEKIEANKKGIDSVNIVLSGGYSKLVFVENTTWHFFYDLLRVLSSNQ
jgi:hypothetical protein